MIPVLHGETRLWVDRGGLRITSRHRAKGVRMGRFGGGWQWELGFMAGNLSRQRGTVIVNCLTFSVRIAWSYPR